VNLNPAIREKGRRIIAVQAEIPDDVEVFYCSKEEAFV
jgi:hypothetical protein